jgi:uncharacterized protein YeaO (DUF488 family)
VASGGKVSVARVYDDVGETSGTRILVDRVWPRGISKEDLKHDDWIRQVAPSSDLRKWFDHDADKWSEFRRRYVSELKDNDEAVGRCLEWCRKGSVALLFAARDREHNQAVLLRNHLCALLEAEGIT